MTAGNLFGYQPVRPFASNGSGQIKMGSGPPSPLVGPIGQLYMDIDTQDVYARRVGSGIPVWGNPLFTVPSGIATLIKFYGVCEPLASLGSNGDYYLYFKAANTPDIYAKTSGAWALDAINTALIVHNPGFNQEVR